MITFCFLLAQGGCEPQLKSHIRGNINVGNDTAFLRKVVEQMIPYIGYPRSLNAFAAIAEIDQHRRNNYHFKENKMKTACRCCSQAGLSSHMNTTHNCFPFLRIS